MGEFNEKRCRDVNLFPKEDFLTWIYLWYIFLGQIYHTQILCDIGLYLHLVDLLLGKQTSRKICKIVPLESFMG